MQSPDRLLDRIKSYNSWWNAADSVWMVTTDGSLTDARDELWSAMGDAGELLIVDITEQSWAHAGIDGDGTAWLKDHVR